MNQSDLQYAKCIYRYLKAPFKFCARVLRIMMKDQSSAVKFNLFMGFLSSSN